MTKSETKAWWRGVAATSSGKIVINQVDGEADVVNFKILPKNYVHRPGDKPDLQSDILLANAKQYKIVSTMRLQDGRLHTIVLEYNGERRIIKCHYDTVVKYGQEYSYLRRVGLCVVEGIEWAGIEDDLKLQTKNVIPRYGNWEEGDYDTRVVPDYADGYDGLSQVSVATSPTLLPENIKAGVNIYGVEGTATGGAGLTEIDFTDTDGSLTASLDDDTINQIQPTKDENGLITGITINNDKSITVEYDEAGRLVKVGSVDIRNIGQIDLPKDGNKMLF